MPPYEGIPIKIDPTRAAPNSGAIPVEPASATTTQPGPMQPPAGGFARPAPESRQTNAIEELYCKYQNHYLSCKIIGPGKDTSIFCKITFEISKLIVGGCVININPLQRGVEIFSQSILKYHEYSLPVEKRNSFYITKNQSGELVLFLNDDAAFYSETYIFFEGLCGPCCDPLKQEVLNIKGDEPSVIERVHWKEDTAYDPDLVRDMIPLDVDPYQGVPYIRLGPFVRKNGFPGHYIIDSNYRNIVLDRCFTCRL